MVAHRAPRRPFRLFRAVAVGVLLLVLGPLIATPAAATTGTYVRLAQLAAQMPFANLVVSSVADPANIVTITGLGYGQLSAYQRIEPGDYVLSLRPADAAQPPLVSTTLHAVAGEVYTLAAVETGAERALKILMDDLTPPASGQARVRVINAGSPADQLDVRGAGGEAFGLGLRRGDASDYRSVPAGSLVLTVGQTGSARTDVAITAGANQVVTVVLVRTGGTLGASAHVDAEGSAAAPGPVHAGFGGAAAERAGGAAGVLVMLAMAAAAAALAGLLARRRDTARR